MKAILLPILMYHKVSNDEAKGNYIVSIEAFEDQMRYLSENGFKTVVPEEIRYLNEKPTHKLIMITFDDGFETDYTRAYPILKKYGFRAVCFITTDFVSKKGHLTWEQIKKLKEEGFSIQSHSHTHPLFGMLEASVIRKEISISKKIIEDKLNMNVISLALPGGSHPGNIKEIAQEQGYQYVFNSKPCINMLNGREITFFGRALINKKTSLEEFRRVVNADKVTFLMASLFYHLKNIIKKLIGQKIYYLAWRRYFV